MLHVVDCIRHVHIMYVCMGQDIRHKCTHSLHMPGTPDDRSPPSFTDSHSEVPREVQGVISSTNSQVPDIWLMPVEAERAV